jgi:sporulation protein YlmC with PRC-barrel domain
MATATPSAHAMIASDRVEGTPVYRSTGKKIGQIERMMIDKASGKVGYAVMSFGGFLGIGHDHYPLPWQLLTYDTKLEGYVVDVSDEQLKGAPKFAAGHESDWGSRDMHQKVHSYYGVTPIWY